MIGLITGLASLTVGLFLIIQGLTRSKKRKLKLAITPSRKFMPYITEAELPINALSAKCIKQGAFADCFYIDIPKEVVLAEFIKAFYTTALFKTERAILSVVTLKPASDAHAVELAAGRSKHYSAWVVEERVADQIILADISGRTKSWLMVQASDIDGCVATRLYFGSVVVPKKAPDGEKARMGLLFHLLGGFHKLYSRALLKSAYNKLLKVNTIT